MPDSVLAPLQEIGGGLAQAFGLGLLPTQLNPIKVIYLRWVVFMSSMGLL